MNPAPRLQPDPHFRMRESLRALGVPGAQLATDESAFLQENGYLALRGVLPERDVALMRERLRKILRAEGPWAGLAEPVPSLLRLAECPDRAARLRCLLARATRTGARSLFRLAPGLRARAAALGNALAPPRASGARAALERLAGELATALAAEADQGPGAREVSNLINKSPLFDPCLTHPRVLAGVQRLLGPGFRLFSLDARSPRPQRESEPLQASSYGLAGRHLWHGCTALWVLDDDAGDNGALRVVPGSHRWRRPPIEVLADPRRGHPLQRVLLEPAGTVILLHGHLWHAPTRELSGDERWSVVAAFARRDVAPEVDQRRLVTERTLRRLDAAARTVLGVEGQSDLPERKRA